MDFLEELEQAANPIEAQPIVDETSQQLAAMQTRLDQLEAEKRTAEEKHRKLTQYALGVEVTPEDYNTQLKTAMETNPLGYTQVVSTTEKNVMSKVDERIQLVEEKAAAERAVFQAQQKYPELQTHQDVIGLFADQVLSQVQQGLIKDVNPKQYDKIIDIAVGEFRKRFPTASRGQSVMSLDVGTHYPTDYGTQSVDQELARINALPDAQFKEAVNRVSQRGTQFQF
jgi:hypothetical protein